jgi:hypothetical protein
MDKLNESTKHVHFSLGQIVATPGAIDALEKSNQTPLEFLRLHLLGDWGDLCDTDKKLNDEAIANEHTAGTDNDLRGRVLSAYKTKLGEKLWIITEADRSSTCILLPDEY